MAQQWILTHEKILEDTFNNQISYKSIMEHNVMGSFQLNRTQKLCSEGQRVFPFILKLQEDGTTNGFFSRVYPNIPTLEQRQEYASIFNRKNMLDSFAAGKTHFTYQHKYEVSLIAHK
ncbi:hypothetical protein [Eubacterium aggregans]|uniref:hypothetical protein n=1 Tax=Eubacterium aggregans TaxID=81409 RepID=UPI003F2EC12B